MSERVYRFAVLFAIGFAFAHLISLPIGITYDGFQYLDGADVLGSSRFPADWYRNRTPLYSLALKASFLCFGKQPLAAMLVSTVMGLGTTLLLGRAARSLAGAWSGAAVVIVVSLFPTAVAYQHLILTETGTSFFIVSLIAVALQKPKTERAVWIQALLFSGVLAAGYYWRQLLLNLAPVAAALWLMRNWTFVRQGGLLRPRALGRMAIAALLILVAPVVISHLWDPFADRAGLAEITMRQGIIRQALLAPSDPVVGENNAAYIDAVRESVSEGNFFSGVRNDLFDPLLDRLFRDRPMGTGDTKRVFVSGIVHYPFRYLSGVARTTLLFIGAKATVNENRIFRAQILSPTWLGAKIGDGPPQVQDRIKQQFQQITTPSVGLRLLGRLCPLYDFLLLIANVVAIMVVPYALITRNYEDLALAAFPAAYLGLYAIILASIDRFAMPAYPATLAISIIVPVLIFQRFRSKRSIAQGSSNVIAVAATENLS